MGLRQDELVGVIDKGRVVACSTAARSAGVAVGQRRREAQFRCPGLELRPSDPALELRAFEPVLAALEEFGAPVAVTAPGRALVRTRGPARYFGGEAAFARRVGEAIAGVLPHLEQTKESASCEMLRCEFVGSWWAVGIADGAFGATEAAERGLIVPRGKTAAFLADLPISLIGDRDLADLLFRLGITTLGAFAALDEGAVSARFSALGTKAHLLARGLEVAVPLARGRASSYVAEIALDPAIEGVEAAVFVARSLAEELADKLLFAGYSATLIEIAARTTDGERLARRWSHESALSSSLVAERLRGQLECWISSRDGEGLFERGGGIEHVSLGAVEVTAAIGHQPELSNSIGRDRTDVDRVLARVQAVLGPKGVLFGELTGGRGPSDQIHLVSFGELRSSAGRRTAPWPGRLLAPSPTAVFSPALAAKVVDKGGVPVSVDARGAVSAAPASLSIDGAEPVSIVWWAGPWPVEERWWDADTHRRRARFQVLLETNEAVLLGLERGVFTLEGRYD